MVAVDFRRFLEACREEYVPERSNCVTAALAAFPGAARLQARCAAWRDEPLLCRLADYSNPLAWAHELARSLRLKQVNGLEAAGAWGVVDLGPARAVCVIVSGRCFVRSKHGAMQVPAGRLLVAWEVA